MFDDWEFGPIDAQLNKYRWLSLRNLHIPLYLFPHTSLQNQPRHYPYRFGLRMLRILPKLQADAAKKHFPKIPVGLEAVAIYNAQKFDDLWQDSLIPECIEYIRSNKHLTIPSDWEQVLLPQ